MTNKSEHSADDLIITSLQNDRVKAIRALDMRKERKATGLFVAEGTSVLVMAQDCGVVPETIVRRSGGQQETTKACSVCDWAIENGAAPLLVSERVLEKLANKDSPQSLLAVFRQRWATLPPPKIMKPDDLWLVLEEIRDPGNLGTIIRTAHAVGATGIILVGQCCDPYARDCVRATMGSIFAMPLVRATVDEFVSWRHNWPGDVVATHLKGDQDFRNMKVQGPVLILMGSEGPGLSDALVDQATTLVRIPMAGTLDSLNLAVASALMMYEVKRTALEP